MVQYYATRVVLHFDSAIFIVPAVLLWLRKETRRHDVEQRD